MIPVAETFKVYSGLLITVAATVIEGTVRSLLPCSALPTPPAGESGEPPEPAVSLHGTRYFSIAISLARDTNEGDTYRESTVP